MSESLSYSAGEKKRGRKYFSLFGLINALAFLFLTGNVITLYGLKLGASRTLLGTLGAFPYLALLIMPLGRGLVRRMGVIKVLKRSWMARYLSLVPVLFAPLLVASGQTAGAFLTLGIGVLLFHLFRGVGMVSDAPLIGALAEGPDRGAFLARFQIIIALASVAGGLVIVLLLAGDAPVWRYTVLLTAGIALGIADVTLLSRIPEPPGARQAASRPFAQSIAGAFRSANMRLFVLGFGLFGALSSSVRAFLVVYARQVYEQPDNLAMLYAVVGSTGWVLMGFLARRVIDRLGAKPILIFFALVFLISLIPMITTPSISGDLGVEVFLGIVFFVATMGVTGGEYSAQTYFYGMIDESERLDLGMLFFITLGAGGVVGSFAGGLLLDWLAEVFDGDSVAAFRTFFGFLAFLLVVGVLVLSRLQRLGARSVASALSVIFSFRDMRTLGLLDRLSRSSSIDDERRAIRRLANTRSGEAGEDLATRLSSPTFAVRLQALTAIESLPLTPAVEKALEEHVAGYHFSSAYRAAEILGRRRVARGMKVLEASLSGEDLLLVSKAMVALARLRAEALEGRIAEIMEGSHNPMVVLHGVTALHILGLEKSIPALLRCMSRGDIPDFIRDEIVVALADICGFGPLFYRGYRFYLGRLPLKELIDEWIGESPVSEGLSSEDLYRALADQSISEGLVELLPKKPKELPWLEPYRETVGDINILVDTRGRLLLVAMVINLVHKGFLDPSVVSGYFQAINPNEENP
ncbi:MAG: MFS transporter [Spirochaetaceae bacterium]